MQAIRFLLLLGACAPVLAHAQSDAASRASAASIEHLSVVPAAAFDLLAAGGTFSVAAVRPVGDAFDVVLHGVAGSADIAVRVTGASAHALADAVGATVTASAVAGGCLLRIGAETIAFVPDAAIQALAHHRELHP